MEWGTGLSGMENLFNFHIKHVCYSGVRSEEVSCSATYHFRTGLRPTMGKRFSG